MGHSLSEAAVRGTQASDDEVRKFLDAGDIDGLMAHERQRFGGFTMMADDPDDDPDDDGDADDEDEDEDEEDEDDTEDSKSKGKSAAQKRIEELSAEAKGYRKKASERGRRIRDLEAKVAELEKGKSTKQGEDDTEDKTSEEITQLKGDFEKVLTDNEQLRIENAFLRNSKFRWKNPRAALKLADLSDVEIDDDGEVEGLDDALEALAKSDPYLLADDKQGDDDEDDTAPRKKRTGQPTGKSKKGQPNRDALIAKYPALRR